MRKLITLTLSILLLGLFAAVVFAAVDSGDDPSSPAATTETTETPDTTTTPETTTTPDTTTTPEDISGPCDEAEHANDPRCTGTGGERVDNSGPGSVDSGKDDAVDDDRSGRKHREDDSSGRGHREDDSSGQRHGHDDDSSGHDDDSSGHGSGGDDD